MAERTGRAVTEHYLKTWPGPLTAMVSGLKTFEFRRNDRNFQIGDTLQCAGWDPTHECHTGEIRTFRVTYILHGGQFGVPEGYCVMSIVPLDYYKMRPEQ